MWTSFGKAFKTALLGAGALLIGQVANATVITFDQTNLNVNEGDLFTLTLIGQDFAAGTNGSTADGTLGGGVSLSWDPSVITLASLGDVDLVFPGDQFFAPAPVLDTAGGTLSLSVASFFGTSLTDFNIATLTFTAAQTGMTSVGIVVSPLDVWADGVGAVDVTPAAVGGMVTVTGITVVPLPASVMLLFSGLLGLVAIGRTRTQRGTRHS